MWWAWDPTARNLWPAIHSVAWERYHNPVELLGAVEPSAWQALEGSDSFNDRYNEVVRKFDNYMAGKDTWWKRHHRVRPHRPDRLFVHRIRGPFLGPLLLGGSWACWPAITSRPPPISDCPSSPSVCSTGRGYFRQEVDSEGEQQHTYPELDMTRLPIRPGGGQHRRAVQGPHRVPRSDGAWPRPGASRSAGPRSSCSTPTFPTTSRPTDRSPTPSTSGVGRCASARSSCSGWAGSASLAAQAIEPAVWHVNEGHAAMSLLERISGGRQGRRLARGRREGVRSPDGLHPPHARSGGERGIRVHLGREVPRPMGDFDQDGHVVPRPARRHRERSAWPF